VDNAESFSAPPEHAYEATLRTLLRPEEVWEIIREIGLMERHFHQMQHHYRLLASTWILAVFAAAGFLLARNELYLVSLPKDVAIPKELAIAMLTIFGGIGIALLWIMDLRIYGMLLRGVFNTGMELEKNTAGCPQYVQNT
jgi:hypothetical protein